MSDMSDKSETVLGDIAMQGRGSGLRVAIVDSGVNFDHPHLGVTGQSFEVFWTDDGTLESRIGPVRDHFGHGTCCAALIHWLAPEAELLAVKVTGDRATTDADRLARGISVAVSNSANIVCVPMATETRIRRSLDEAVTEAVDQDCLVIASDPGGIEALPAQCPGALAVGLYDGVDVALRAGKVCADGHARAFAGSSGNFYGPSLSAARVAAACARFAEISNFRGPELMMGFKKRLRMI